MLPVEALTSAAVVDMSKVVVEAKVAEAISSRIVAVVAMLPVEEEPPLRLPMLELSSLWITRRQKRRARPYYSSLDDVPYSCCSWPPHPLS